MSVVNNYHVLHHWEKGGKEVSQRDYTHVGAAANDYNTLAAVITGNAGKAYPGATLVIDNVKNIGVPVTQ